MSSEPANFEIVLPMRSSQGTVNADTSPFRFLDLPKEIQSRIIETALTIERKAFRPGRPSEDPLDVSSPKIYDFNINAFGMRSHTLPPFGLLFVNKEVSGDALAVVYQNSSFAVYAEVSRDGRSDYAFGYIPKVVKHISPMVMANAREVTYRISTINEGPESRHPDSPQLWNNSVVLKRALGHLQILVNQATFPHVKTLNVVLMTEGFVQKHLNVILKLFIVTSCGVTLGEVCNGKFGAQGSQERDKEFLEMVQIAAKECGQNWMLTETPIVTLVVRHSLWRGARVSWARHREWKNRKFAGSGQALLPLGLSK